MNLRIITIAIFPALVIAASLLRGEEPAKKPSFTEEIMKNYKSPLDQRPATPAPDATPAPSSVRRVATPAPTIMRPIATPAPNLMPLTAAPPAQTLRPTFIVPNDYAIQVPSSELTREEAASLTEVNFDEFSAHAQTLVGKVIRLKLQWRSLVIASRSDSLFQGSVFQHVKIKSSRFGASYSSERHVDVIVPPDGLKWFDALPVSGEAIASRSAIARIIDGGAARTTPRILIIGQAVVTDRKGTRAIW